MTLASRLIEPDRVAVGSGATDPALEQLDVVKRTILFLFVLIYGFYLFLGVVLLAKGNFTSDPDAYWHIAVGRTIWQTGTLPHVDELSHTFRGQPWIAKEWLGQLIFFAAYTLDSWRGVALLTAAVAALTYALLFLTLARSMRLTVAIGLATTAFVFSLGHFASGRPQILADPLIVIWVASLIRSVENRTSPSFMLLPVMTLWANVHGSFTFGLAIAGALAVEAFFSSPADQRFRTAGRWATFLVAAFAFVCITPYGIQPMLMTLQVFVGNDALHYIQEWRPATPETLGVDGPIILGLLFLALYHGVKLPLWRLLSIIGLVYLMFAHVRFAALFAIVVPLLLVTPLTKQFPFLRLSTQIATEPSFFSAMARASKRFLYPVCIFMVADVAAFAAFGPTMAPNRKVSPNGAVDYIQREHLSGNIYNPHDFGGYLIFRGIKTFIDGRNDQLFTGGFATRLYDAVDQHPTKFIEYLAAYNVSIALVIPDSREAQELSAAAGWQNVYSDDVSELFQKR
jgi:hypothetical protein